MRHEQYSLSEHRRAEARHAPRRIALYAALAGVGMIAGCQWLFVRLHATLVWLGPALLLLALACAALGVRAGGRLLARAGAN